MTRKEILSEAKLMPKRSYRIYTMFKNMLTENLTSEEYKEFIDKLVKILKV